MHSSLCLLLLTSVALAGPATEFLRGKRTAVRPLAQSRDVAERARSTEEVAAFTAIDTFAEAVLADTPLTREERTLALVHLGTIFVRELRTALVADEVRFRAERLDAGQTVVETSNPGGANVDFVMIRVDSEWHVRDIITEGVSLAKNYKYEINRQYATGGMPSVNAALQKKLDELDAQDGQDDGDQDGQDD